jgi:hypothetical protein
VGAEITHHETEPVAEASAFLAAAGLRLTEIADRNTTGTLVSGAQHTPCGIGGYTTARAAN